MCLSTLPLDSRTLISKWNARFTFIWKKDFGPLSNSPVIFSLAQVRRFWWCFCFRSCLVALFLKMSEHLTTLDALTPASVHSLWSSPKCLNQLCLTLFSSLRSSLLLVHIFQPNFFLPVNFAFNILWCSTPSTATPSVTYPLNVFWTISKSAVFPIIVVSKNKRYTEFILYGWSFIGTQMLIFWDTDFWLSWAVSANQN